MVSSGFPDCQYLGARRHNKLGKLMANLDTEQKRLSGIMLMMPFRGPGVWPADTGFKVANRQAAALLYSGVTVLTYSHGLEAGKLVDGAEV